MKEIEKRRSCFVLFFLWVIKRDGARGQERGIAWQEARQTREEEAKKRRKMKRKSSIVFLGEERQ